MLNSNVKRRIHKFFTIIMSIVIMVTSCAVITSSSPVSAKTIKDLEQNIKDLENKNKQLATNIKSIEGKIDSLQEQRELLNTQITNTQTQIDLYKEKISIMTKNIAAKTKEINVKSAEIEKNKDLFAQRVKAIYIKNSTSAFSTILSAKSFGDFLSQTEIMKKISKSDKELIGKLNTQNQELSEAKNQMLKENTELAKTKSAFDKKSTDLTSLKSQNSATQVQYEQLQQKYVNNQKQNEAQIKREDAQLEKMIRESLTNGSPGPEGAFKWPVPSSKRLTSPYGWRFIAGYKEFHRGIDIGAGTGTPIVAAHTGTVTAVTRSPARGLYLIVEHGGGLATLYQHCSAISATVGQKVTRGQKIASVGETGYSFGSHLHFEVRKNGVTVNPMGYVKIPS